ncbi:MAG: PEP-CTERM sorting domain-containing protein [Pseudomonadota bacterium]
MKTMLKALALASACVCGSASASAPACTLSDISGFNASECWGWFGGNLLQANDYATVWALTGGAVDTTAAIQIIAGLPTGGPITFSSPLYGDTIIGVHMGGGAFPDGGNDEATAFFHFDAGTDGVTTLNLTFTQGYSNAAVYTTAVPEPGSYAMLLAGLGVLGWMSKRRS